MVVTELAVASTRLLGPGSKLYPSNMPGMPSKNLTPFMQSISRVTQNQAREREAPLAAGCIRNLSGLVIKGIGSQNPGNICLWNPEYTSKNPESHEIQNPSSNDKDLNPVPGIRNPRRGI